jgi:RNA polymerase sigma-70 factor, ECF subfamily
MAEEFLAQVGTSGVSGGSISWNVGMAADRPGSDPEDNVVRNARNGMPGAFEVLLNRYHAAVYRQILLWVNGDYAAADDVAQEAWWRIARGVTRFEGRSGFYAWACRIARNEAKRWLSRNARRPRLMPPPGAVDADELERQESDELVRSVLKRLPEKFAAPLLLELWEDMSLKEIAHALGIPEGTVKSRLHRAREKFRELWDAMNLEEQ